MSIIKKFFGFKVWLPIMLVFLIGIWVQFGSMQTKQTRTLKKLPEISEYLTVPKKDGGIAERFRPPPPAPAPAPVAPSRDWIKDILTYGGGLSVLVNLINLLSKIGGALSWLAQKLRRKHDK